MTAWGWGNLTRDWWNAMTNEAFTRAVVDALLADGGP